MISAHIAIRNLRTENEQNPLGIDTGIPRFGWNLISDQYRKLQTAYQIQLSDDRALLLREQGVLWDTGKVLSRQSTFIDYAGPALASSKCYYWRIRV